MNHVTVYRIYWYSGLLGLGHSAQYYPDVYMDVLLYFSCYRNPPARETVEVSSPSINWWKLNWAQHPAGFIIECILTTDQLFPTISPKFPVISLTHSAAWKQQNILVAHFSLITVTCRILNNQGLFRSFFLFCLKRLKNVICLFRLLRGGGREFEKAYMDGACSWREIDVRNA
jgi:hypothetical protein